MKSIRSILALLGVAALVASPLAGCGETTKPETAEAKRAMAICGGEEGKRNIEMFSPNVKAACDTVPHAEQAVREKHEEGQAAVEFMRAKEVEEARHHKEIEAEAEIPSGEEGH